MIATDDRHRHLFWRWQAKKPLHIVGVTEGVLLLRERLSVRESRANDRIAVLLERGAEAKPEIQFLDSPQWPK